MKHFLLTISFLILTGCGGGGTDSSVICLYGDSTTKYNPYAEISHLSPINKGVGSSKASDLLTGNNEFYKTPWSEEVKNACTTVVLNFGLNDAYVEGHSANVFAARVANLRDIAESANKRVIIETPNPMLGYRGDLVAEYADALRGIGGLIVDNHGLFGNSFKNEWMSDSAHPNNLGYSEKSKNLLKNL